MEHLSNTRLVGLNTDDFEAEQMWYYSHDGTKVAMFIIRHRHTTRDETAPAFHHGKGAIDDAVCARKRLSSHDDLGSNSGADCIGFSVNT